MVDVWGGYETFNQVDIVYCSGKHEHAAAVCLKVNDRVAEGEPDQFLPPSVYVDPKFE